MNSNRPICGFAERVRDARSRMDLTQAQFAERMAVTPLTVHRWETGQSRPRALALERLQALEEATSTREAVDQSGAAHGLPISYVPLDFAGDPAAVLLVAEAYRLAHGHQFNAAFASETARIDPLPHQRIAVYERMLPQEPLRFLLADDAGAGKTIMTGLYVREMLFRRRIRRVLIVPPAGLVGNWERELRTLFRLQCRIVSGTDCRDGANPFVGTDGDRVIVSLDTLVTEWVFRALRNPDVAPYDLVVFDEAHKLSASRTEHRVTKTRRYELAEALAGVATNHVGPDSGVSGDVRFAGLTWAARHLLLLTATPHMGKESPWHHLWRLLDHHALGAAEALRRFPPDARQRYFIRRTKEEMVDLAGNPVVPAAGMPHVQLRPHRGRGRGGGALPPHDRLLARALQPRPPQPVGRTARHECLSAPAREFYVGPVAFVRTPNRQARTGCRRLAVRSPGRGEPGPSRAASGEAATRRFLRHPWRR